MVRVSASVKRAPARRGSSGWGRVGAAPGWATGVGRRGGAVSRSGQFTQARHEPVERKCVAGWKSGCDFMQSIKDAANGVINWVGNDFRLWARTRAGQLTADGLALGSLVVAGVSLLTARINPTLSLVFLNSSIAMSAASTAIVCANGMNFDCGLDIFASLLGPGGKSVRLLRRAPQVLIDGVEITTRIWGDMADGVSASVSVGNIYQWLNEEVIED